MDGWAWSDFATSPPMSTYILAFAITPFANVERIYKSSLNEQTVAVRFWTRPEKVHQMNFIADLATEMFQYLENWLQVPYSLDKIDFVAIPGYKYDAMENWGLVVHRSLHYYLASGQFNGQLANRIGN